MGTAAGLLLRTASGWTAISSVGVALVTALVVQLLGQRPDTDRQTTFWIRAFALPLAALLPLSSIMLLALRRSVQSVAAHRILRPILLIATIAFVSFLLQHEVDASDTMMIWALVSLAALGVSVTWIPKHLPTEIADTAPTERRREWLSVAVTLDLGDEPGPRDQQDGCCDAGSHRRPRFSARYSQKQHEDMQLLLRNAFRLIVVFTIPVQPSGSSSFYV